MPSALTPDMLHLVEAIARTGSFARAARETGRVPSAVTYSIRKLEDQLDVLLFDRGGRRAVLTPAGETLLRDGRLVLRSLDALAARVKRAADGWELELRIAVSVAVSWDPLYELIARFQEIGSATRLQFSSEVLSGNWDALMSERADLVIGADTADAPARAFQSRPLGSTRFAFCVAPHHPLAQVRGPLAADEIARYCAIVVADTSRALPVRTRGLLEAQPQIVMPSMAGKVEAQIRGIGVGYLPLAVAAPYLSQGLLVACETAEGIAMGEDLVVAWRQAKPGKALRWWLEQFEHARLRDSLLRHAA